MSIIRGKRDRFKNKDKIKFCETVSYVYSYQFTCKYCDYETKWFPVEIIENGYTEKKDDYEPLEMKEQKKLKQKADKRLQLKIFSIKEEIKNGTYEVYQDKCPNCLKKQSWSLKGREFQEIVWGIVFFIAALMITQFSELVPDTLVGFGSVAAFFIGIAAGYLHRLLRKREFIRSIENQQLKFNWEMEQFSAED